MALCDDLFIVGKTKTHMNLCGELRICQQCM